MGIMGDFMGNYAIGQFVEMVDLATLGGPLETPIPKRWYVLQLHPNREGKVMRTFRQRNISAYLPMTTKSQTVIQRRHGFERQMTRNVTCPLFPGLVFIPDFECTNDRSLDVDGVIGYLRFGDWTAHLSSEDMFTVRALEAIENTPPSKRERLFEIGQLVRIVDGPFRAFAGRIGRLDSKGRLSVLVEIFGRLSLTDVSEGQIEAV